MAEHEVTEAMVDAACEAERAYEDACPRDWKQATQRNRIRAILTALAARTTDASAVNGAVAWIGLHDGKPHSMPTIDRDELLRGGYDDADIAPLFTHPTGAGADANALDAARYRWLRDHVHYCRDDEHAYPYATVKVYFDRDERGSVSRMTVWPCDGVGAASLNTAIDAAMCASSPQQRAGDGG